MTEQDLRPRSGLGIVAAIGQEFERTLRDQRAALPQGRIPVRRGARLLAIGVAAGLLSVGAAGAATGLLPVGSVISGGSDSETDYEHGSEDQTIVARGTSPVAGPWRLTMLRTNGHAETGESPGDCLQLLLSQPPQGTPIGATILCQDVGNSDFKTDSVPVIDGRSGDAEVLLFGLAPEPATSIELSTDSGKTIHAKAYETPPRFAGHPWVLTVPSGRTTGQVEWVDRNGIKQDKVDVTTHFERLAIWERQLGASRN